METRNRRRERPRGDTTLLTAMTKLFMAFHGFSWWRRARRHRRRLKRARRFAPRARVAARNHPVDEARDDSGTRHDFEMTPHDALEAQRLSVERDKPEIAGKPDQPAAERVGQRAADAEGFGDRGDDHGRQQRKAGDENEAEAEHDVH